MSDAPMVPIRIDGRSVIPPFEQVRAQISLLVASGRLQPGARLPTVRALATHLGLAANTVARAYRELDREGIVTPRGRAGTFVSATPPVAYAVMEKAERLRDAAATFAVDTLQLGVGPSEALEAVATALRELAD